MGKVVGLIVGCVVVGVLGAIVLWTLAPSWVSRKLSEQAQVEISIDRFSLSTSSVAAHTILVGNPPRSILPQALEVDLLHIEAPPTALLQEHVVLKQLLLDTVYVGLEFESNKSKKGNWSTIINNLQQSAEPATSTDKPESTRTLLIEKLLIRNLSIELAYRDSGKVRRLKPIPLIEIEQVSSEGGLPTAQIMQIVMRETLRQLLSIEGLTDLLNPDLLQEPGKQLFKGIFSNYVGAPDPTDAGAALQ